MKSYKFILGQLLVCVFLVLSGTDAKACSTLSRPVPNSIKHTRYNTECFANAINRGRKIRIDDTYYVSRADALIHKDIVISGSGKLILTDSEFFTVNAPISVNVKGITITTTQPKRYNSQIRFIVSKSKLYHKEVRFERCVIEGVRVYTQIADDVDQVRVKDGVKKFVFKGNKVFDTGYYLVRLGSCLCEEAVIENNEFRRMLASLFDFGQDNDYRHLSFSRFKTVIFNNNVVDNEGVPLDKNYDYLYCTPLLAECDYAECKNNVFRSIISVNENPIALYAFYLSGNTVVIAENQMEDCINLGNSTYNAMFKCKSGGDRYITDNSFVVTESCLKKYGKRNDDAFVRLISLQAANYGTVRIVNNRIDVACDFVFGSGVRAEYRDFAFENNSIKYNDLGPTAHQLLRLNPATKGDNKIVVRNNVMSPARFPSTSHGLFAYDCSGYTITVTDNVLYGYLPYGDNETEVYSLKSGTSENNTVVLGTKTSLVRVSINMLNIKDRIVSEGEYSIRLYNDSDAVTTQFEFDGKAPLRMVSDKDEVYMTRPMLKGKKSISVAGRKAVME